jgi:hypothetical protein
LQRENGHDRVIDAAVERRPLGVRVRVLLVLPDLGLVARVDRDAVGPLRVAQIGGLQQQLRRPQRELEIAARVTAAASAEQGERRVERVNLIVRFGARNHAAQRGEFGRRQSRGFGQRGAFLQVRLAVNVGRLDKAQLRVAAACWRCSAGELLGGRRAGKDEIRARGRRVRRLEQDQIGGNFVILAHIDNVAHLDIFACNLCTVERMETRIWS